MWDKIEKKSFETKLKFESKFMNKNNTFSYFIYLFIYLLV